MKIQLLTAVTVLALSSSAFAGGGKGHGPKPQTNLNNMSNNSLAVGGETLIGSADLTGLDLAYNRGGRAIAGSIYLEGGACACDFGNIKNVNRNAIAVGRATAGSVHVNTYGYKR